MLEAVADAEEIEVSDEDMLEALQARRVTRTTDPGAGRSARRSCASPAATRCCVEDLRLRKAVDMIAESAKPIAAEQAEAREKIWTPEKEREEKGGLWTPGDPKP